MIQLYKPWEYTQRNLNQPHRYLHIYVYYGTILNSQNVETV